MNLSDLEELVQQVSDHYSEGWGLTVYFSNKFPGDGDAAGPGTTLQEPLL